MGYHLERAGQKHLCVAVSRWVRSPEYQAALVVGADRRDLYRNKAGAVDSYAG
jgi:sRNA-binding protein